MNKYNDCGYYAVPTNVTEGKEPLTTMLQCTTHNTQTKSGISQNTQLDSLNLRGSQIGCLDTRFWVFHMYTHGLMQISPTHEPK